MAQSPLSNILRRFRGNRSAIGYSSEAQGAFEENEDYLKPSEQDDFVEDQNLGGAPNENLDAAPEARSVDENAVLVANVSDQPTAKDTLGFEPYVDAIASFLTNEVTKPPLTLSIEGEWGSGKSSFMLQLEEELRSQNAVVVRFNAWRHDKDDAMWAAFALEFTRKLSRELSLINRWVAHLKFFFRRFNWERGWMEMAKVVFMLMTLVVILLLPILARKTVNTLVTEPAQAAEKNSQAANNGNLDYVLRKAISGGSLLAYLALISALLFKVKGVITNPLRINLKEHLDTPDYKSRVAFIERFHEDFSKAVDVYGQAEKVYVFIDDLDRCEIPKAADLMQALNLMISDSSRLIFIMGMDREKVAAGLAVKYEKLLPYLLASPQGYDKTTPGTFDPVLGLEYGYGFIEKFIQLPFLVPQASELQVKPFLENIFGSTDSRSSAQQLSSPRQGSVTGRRAERAVIENSEMVTEILKMVAPTFDYNPRRLKHFINAFRLKTFIASRTGLFGEPEGPQYDRLTTQQLGKFVAITLRWPLLLTDLDNDLELLSKLQMLVLEKGRPEIEEGNEALVRWYMRDRLRQLLAAGCYVDGDLNGERMRICSLSRLNVKKLLQVAPVIKPPLVKENLEVPFVPPRAIDISATYPKVYGLK